MTEYAFEGAKRSSAAITWSFAGQTLPGDVTRPFSAAIDVAYQGTIAAAFARWSSVSGLVFQQVNDAAAVPIRIGFGTFTNFSELGETDYNQRGGILANDTLIRLLDPAVTPLRSDATLGYDYPAFGVTLYQVALHEIGHALGLDHTTDPFTIMYPYASGLNTDLATGDVYGINALYPLFSVAALDPKQAEGVPGQTDAFHFTITRYSDPAVALTINYSITGAAYAGVVGSIAAPASAFANGAYPRGQVTFLPGATTATLTVSVPGNATAQPDLGFQVNLSTSNPLDSVTVRGTVNAAVLDDDGYGQVSGASIGVYRFFDNTDGAHFYSTSETERNTLIQTRPDLTYEGLALRAIGSPATDSAAAPVYRFFDTVNGTHFYTDDASERNMLIGARPDLTFEGIGFYEHATQQAGDLAVLRFFEASNGTHFYTSSANERATILATRNDLRYEGVAFYAPSA